MRCKNCGFNNSEDAKICKNCSAPLNNEKADVETEDTASWGFLKPSRRSGENERELNEEEFNSLEKDFWPTAEDYGDTPRSPKSARETGGSPNAGRQNAGYLGDERKTALLNTEKFSDAYSDTEFDDEAFDDDERPPQIFRDKKRNAGESARKIDWRKILGLCLIIAALIIVITLVATAGSCKKQDTPRVEIMPDTDNPGNYSVKVYVRPGSALVYENSAGARQETDVSKKGYVVFTVPIAALLPNEPIENDTYEAVPVIYVKDKETGNLEKIENITPVSIDVPKFDLMCENPASFDCENGICVIKGKISDTSVSVFINEAPVGLKDDGSFERELKYDAPGEYNIVIEAKRSGFKVERISLKAVVTEPPDPAKIVEIAPDFVTRVKNPVESIEVKGKVPIGTTIVVKSDDPEFSLKTLPTVDAEGNFTFEVALPRTEKNYEMTITATLPSGMVIERPFSVQRPPLFTEFVQRCWKYSYSDITKSGFFGKRPFVIKGKIAEIIENGDYLKAKLTDADGKTLVIIYHDHYASATPLQIGLTYEMYGIPMRLNEEGNVEVFIWFVHD